jgi:hypothetical protein
MTDLKTFRDRTPNESKLSWEDVYFSVVLEMMKARNNSDTQAFTASVDSLDILTEPFKDDAFYLDNEEYLKRYDDVLNVGDLSLSDNDLLLLAREKAAILMRLVGRFNSGEVSVVESANDTRVISALISKLERGTGQNVVFTGSPGSGKSWASLALGEKCSLKMGKVFTIKNNVAFESRTFMKLINDIENVPPGSSIVFEELGVNLSSKSHMTRLNKLLSAVFQTVRERGILCIMNAPDLGMFEKDVRKLLHFWFETDKLLHKQQQCWTKPHMVELYQQNGDIFYPYPRFGTNEVVKRVIWSPPSKELQKEYLKAEAIFKKQLRIDKAIEMDEHDKSYDPLYDKWRELVISGTSKKEAADIVGIGTNKRTAYNRKYNIERLNSEE